MNKATRNGSSDWMSSTATHAKNKYLILIFLEFKNLKQGKSFELKTVLFLSDQTIIAHTRCKSNSNIWSLITKMHQPILKFSSSNSIQIPTYDDISHTLNIFRSTSYTCTSNKTDMYRSIIPYSSDANGCDTSVNGSNLRMNTSFELKKKLMRKLHAKMSKGLIVWHFVTILEVEIKPNGIEHEIRKI